MFADVRSIGMLSYDITVGMLSMVDMLNVSEVDQIECLLTVDRL